MRGVLELPPELAAVGEALGAGLARVDACFRRQLACDLPPVAGLLGHVERYRGKMLRPIVVMLSGLAAHAEAACGPRDEQITEAHVVTAAVCEMVHMATLVHDDVLDEADERRGGATINALHGNEAAVMLGDYLIAAAYELCAQMGEARTARMIGRMAMAMCAGELLQLHHRRNWALGRDEYDQIVTRKTGELIASAAELGALHAGASETAVAALRAYALNLGVAFQIQDDVLDLTGEQAVVGKSLGKDLEKGKLTLPIIHHLESCGARGPTLERIALASDPAAAPEQRAAAAREIVSGLASTGSVAFARRAAVGRIDRARAALGVLPDSPARRTLDLLARAVVERDR